eukprot:g2598.t1
MRWRWPACALTIVTAVSLWLTASQLHVSQSAVPLDQDGGARFIHLCICSDDSDFRPAVVAIRSAVASSRQAHRFVFHLVTTPELSVRFSRAAKLQLPGVRIEVHADEEIQSAIQSRIEFRDTAGRKGLASAFNFAPFYLPLFLTPSSETFTSQTRRLGGFRTATDQTYASMLARLIYFDADIVLLGDLAEVFDMDMEGKPCAAVPYCNQKMQKYVNFNVLKTLVTSETLPQRASVTE